MAVGLWEGSWLSMHRTRLFASADTPAQAERLKSTCPFSTELNTATSSLPQKGGVPERRT